MKFYSLYRTIFYIIIFTLCQVCLSEESQRVTVYVLSSDTEISPIEKNVTDLLRNNLKSRNLLDDSPVKWELMIAVEEIEQNSIAISVTVLQSMPQEIIDAGSKSQIFYAFLEKDKSKDGTEQNQEIREYVTSEFLSSYKQVIDSEILITQNEKIEDTCSSIVDSFVKKYL